LFNGKQEAKEKLLNEVKMKFFIDSHALERLGKLESIDKKTEHKSI
jgi:hypothetical protein